MNKFFSGLRRILGGRKPRSMREMQNIAQQKFVLLIAGEDDDGKPEAFVTEGRIVCNEADKTVAVYKDDIAEPAFILGEDEFDRIEKVDESMKDDLLGADYMMILRIRTMPDGMESTGGRTLPFTYPGHNAEGQ